MKQTTELFKGENFFHNNLHLMVNRYSEDFSVPFHAHDFIEYCYVAEGKGFHHIEQEIIPVSKGMLFAIPVGVSHVFRPSSPDATGNRLIVYNCLFDAYMVNQLSLYLQDPPIRDQLEALERSISPYFSVLDRDGTIEGLMLKLFRETSVPVIGSATMVHTLLSQLVITIYRQKYTDADKKAAEVSDFDQIVQYLGQHLGETITLSDLARISRWSTRHLQRMFLQHTGQTFGSYMQNLRVQRSCELLIGTGHKISIIAGLVGYRDIDSFNGVFKKIVGQTPIAYRKLHRA